MSVCVEFRRVGLLSGVVAMILALCLPLVAQVRSFTAQSGAKVVAEVLGVSSGDVMLRRRTDGREFQYEIETLSGEDRVFIRKWVSEVKRVVDSGSEESTEKLELSYLKSKLNFRSHLTKAKIMRSGLSDAAYGKRLEKAVLLFLETIDAFLADDRVVLQTEFRQRLTKEADYLREHYLKRVRVKIADKRNDKFLDFPDYPYLPINGVVLNGVPHVKQFKAYCGPASAEMMARYLGVDKGQREIARLSSESSVNHKGTRPSDLARALTEIGVNALVEDQLASDLLDFSIPVEYIRFNNLCKLVEEHGFNLIKREIDKGNPLIPSVRHGAMSTGHLVTVIGYDVRGKDRYIYFRDPLLNEGSAPKEMELSEFIKYWVIKNEFDVYMECITVEDEAP